MTKLTFGDLESEVLEEIAGAVEDKAKAILEQSLRELKNATQIYKSTKRRHKKLLATPIEELLEW